MGPGVWAEGAGPQHPTSITFLQALKSSPQDHCWEEALGPQCGRVIPATVLLTPWVLDWAGQEGGSHGRLTVQ